MINQPQSPTQEKIRTELDRLFPGVGAERPWDLKIVETKSSYAEKLMDGTYLLTLKGVTVASWKLVPMINCCGICVSTLYTGPFDTAVVWSALDTLILTGSQAAPGFMQPEGVVVFHTASRTMFKKTIEKDSEPKGKA